MRRVEIPELGHDAILGNAALPHGGLEYLRHELVAALRGLKSAKKWTLTVCLDNRWRRDDLLTLHNGNFAHDFLCIDIGHLLVCFLLLQSFAYIEDAKGFDLDEHEGFSVVIFSASLKYKFSFENWPSLQRG